MFQTDKRMDIDEISLYSLLGGCIGFFFHKVSILFADVSAECIVVNEEYFKKRGHFAIGILKCSGHIELY